MSKILVTHSNRAATRLCALCVALTLVAACGRGSELNPVAPTALTPTSASETSSPTGTDTPAGTVPSTTPTGPVAVERCSRADLRVAVDSRGELDPQLGGGRVAIDVENLSTHACALTLTTWNRNNSPDIDFTRGQVLVDSTAAVLQPGDRRALGPLALPDGCWQLDLSNGTAAPAEARDLDAIYWRWEGSCRRDSTALPNACAVPVQMSLTWDAVQHAVRMHTSTTRPVSSRVVTIEYLWDGVQHNADAMLGQDYVRVMPQSSTERVLTARGSYIEDNGGSCVSAVLSVSVPAVPVPPTPPVPEVPPVPPTPPVTPVPPVPPTPPLPEVPPVPEVPPTPPTPPVPPVPEVPPTPPSCDVQFPSDIRMVSGAVTPLGDGSTVRASATAVVQNFTGQLGLMWSNDWEGNNPSSWVKQATLVSDPCNAATTTVTVSWDSQWPNHLPARGARYFLVVFQGNHHDGNVVILRTVAEIH